MNHPKEKEIPIATRRLEQKMKNPKNVRLNLYSGKHENGEGQELVDLYWVSISHLLDPHQQHQPYLRPSLHV
jgi:hypothetical protein